jgi:hypothetical protein
MANAKVSFGFFRKQKKREQPKEIKTTPLEDIIKLSVENPDLTTRLINKIINMETPYFVITLCLISFTVLYLVTMSPEIVNKVLISSGGIGWFGYALFAMRKLRKARNNTRQF